MAGFAAVHRVRPKTMPPGFNKTATQSRREGARLGSRLLRGGNLNEETGDNAREADENNRGMKLVRRRGPELYLQVAVFGNKSPQDCSIHFPGLLVSARFQLIFHFQRVPKGGFFSITASEHLIGCALSFFVPALSGNLANWACKLDEWKSRLRCVLSGGGSYILINWSLKNMKIKL